MQTVGSVIAYLDQFAPRELAADWDNVGLLLGDRGSPVERAMTCLTVTPAVAAEAVAGGAQLIVTHHPVLFRAVKRLTTDNPAGAMLLSLLRAGVAVHSPHTAFDNTAGGINEILAGLLGLEQRAPLRRGEGPRQCKVVVFVPDGDLARVSDAMFGAGAGVIGQYSQCSYRLSGTGTFFGSDASNPTVGQKGRREEAAEWRLEVVCPEGRVEAVTAALRAAHSYEEPAFDVYPLKPAAAALGDGRVGRLPRPTPLADLARGLRKSLRCGPVAFVGEPGRLVEKVAVVCGAGGELLGDALRARADVLLTGELRYHDCLRAEQAGLGLVLPGHHATERVGVEELAGRLETQFPDLHVWASREERDPLRWAE